MAANLRYTGAAAAADLSRTVHMALDETSVDFSALDEFSRQLDRRLDEAQAALTQLRIGPGTARPELGAFADAVNTADNYGVILDGYVQRLSGLIDTLAAAKVRTSTILATYRAVEALNDAGTRDIRGLLGTGA
jgi:hypothetical protein